MTRAYDEKITLRQAAIFRAGADAKEPKPFFQGATLGSMEARTFFDGYAWTHPGFENPYGKSYFAKSGKPAKRLRQNYA